MNTNSMLAAGLALALAAPLPALAQHAGNGPGPGGPAMEGMMSSEMHEQMREMMRPMMWDMMREMMTEMQSEASPEPSADAGHDPHHEAGDALPPGSPATEAYRAANLAMHEAMDIDFTDDADIDFARGMIGHHQGAIDMARIVLEHGEDPELRQLAEEIIEAQEAEIEFLHNWLAEREG